MVKHYLMQYRDLINRVILVYQKAYDVGGQIVRPKFATNIEVIM